MKILFFILSLAVFRPLTAQADTVFDDTQTYLMARVVRLSRDAASSSSTLQVQAVSKTSDQNVKAKTGDKRCATNKRFDGSKCETCPANGKCNGTSEWYCFNNYWKNGTSCTKCNSYGICKGNTDWACIGQNGATWNTSNAYMGNSTTPVECKACSASTGGSLAVCNGGTVYHCSGYSTSKSWNTGYAYKETNGVCTKCPPNMECSGYDNAYGNGYQCYGLSAGSYKASYKLDTEGKTLSTRCSDCPSGAVCRGTKHYYCDSTHYRNNSNTCAACSNIVNASQATCSAEPTNDSGTHKYHNFTCANGYFQRQSSNHTGGDDFNECAQVSGATICKAGYNKKYSEDNGNKIYCLQETTVTSTNCPDGFVWIDERTETRGPYGSGAVIWKAGCYPAGDCGSKAGSGYACMIAGFNNGKADKQCKKKLNGSTGYTGISCSF